ncbi:MAG: tRNA uridine(34) 5-carboxymethylaminomethyl modification radical SAM/GNAT enzyme Elp3 [Promethearchaeia archaeon]
MSAEEYSLHRAIIKDILQSDDVLDRHDINTIKKNACSEFGASRVPSNADVLQSATEDEWDELQPLLQKRPVRTASGVAVVAAMTEPHECPHGQCAYCPGGPKLGIPQSYTGHEPATMRGIQNAFDPYLQVKNRLDQLRATGHSVQKVELIVMGGDWCSKDQAYREWFVTGCLEAMNGEISTDFEQAKKKNETADVRNVGTTFETRPDQICQQTVDEMLDFGGTRVEIGVQVLRDDLLNFVDRGHGVKETAEATQILRDSGFKICYHMMPGLPGSSIDADIGDFEKLFNDTRFQPDMMKIYPTIVVDNTELYNWWKNNEYEPYTNEEIVELVSRAVSKMPEYVRIQRMQRDIPIHQIEAGLSKGNLRELVHDWMKDRNLRNPTIRYREIAHFQRRSDEMVKPENIELIERTYPASGGNEVFLSFEEPNLDVILGFLRLRKPSNKAHRREISEVPSAIIRELRVYGPVVNIGERDEEAWQHLGLGEQLLVRAEQITENDFGAERLLVLSGVGVKEYYRNLGFNDCGPYLAKFI